jgi:hypothetical protein
MISAPDFNGPGNRSLAPRHAATLPGNEGLVELWPHNYKPRSHPRSGAPAPGERTRRQGREVDGLIWPLAAYRGRAFAGADLSRSKAQICACAGQRPRPNDGCVITPLGGRHPTHRAFSLFHRRQTATFFGVPDGSYLLGFVAGFLTFGAGVRFGGGAEAGVCAADEGLAARRCIEPNRSPQMGSSSPPSANGEGDFLLMDCVLV